MRRKILATLVPALLLAGATVGAVGTAGAAPAQPAAAPVYSQDFEGEAVGPYRGGLDVADCGGDRGKCLESNYEPTENGSARNGYEDPLPAGDEYTLNYDVRFAADFEFVRGGKLPGLGPDEQAAGCEAVTPEGWSARGMWKQEGTLIGYLYHQDRAGDCGDNLEAEGFTFEKDRWYRLGVHVKVNSSGSAADGSVTYFVDGQERAKADGLRLRGVDGDQARISQVIVGTFYGGSDETWAPSTVTTAHFDNFTVNPGRQVD